MNNIKTGDVITATYKGDSSIQYVGVEVVALECNEEESPIISVSGARYTALKSDKWDIKVLTAA